VVFLESAASRYEQVVATIVTVSTFSFGAFALDDVAELALALGAVAELLADAESRVPLMVTLCPTCGVNLLSSPSSRYVAAAELLGLADAPAPAAGAGADPVVPVADAEPVPRIALARMYSPPADALVPDVPVAAVACSAFWIQPVNVTLSLELELCAVEDPAVCAARLAAAAKANAAHVAVQTFRCIVASSKFRESHCKWNATANETQSLSR
jgi:hypothetical protein